MKKFSIRNNLVLHTKTTTLQQSQEQHYFVRTNKIIPFQFSTPSTPNPLLAKLSATQRFVANTSLQQLKHTYSVVLLNYARPQNIPLVLKSLIESEFITDIIISNGNLKTAIQYTHPKVLIFDDSSLNALHGLDLRFLRMLDCKSENVIENSNVSVDNSVNNYVYKNVQMIFHFTKENITFLTKNEKKKIVTMNITDAIVDLMIKIYDKVENQNFFKPNKSIGDISYLNEKCKFSVCGEKEFIKKIIRRGQKNLYSNPNNA